MKESGLAFLVGSGISLASGAPTVGKITENVLEGVWKNEDDWQFYPVSSGESSESLGVAAQAQAMIRIVHDEIKDHLRSREGRMPNYEDYFAALQQIVQDAVGEIVNPLIRDTVENIRRTSAYLHQNFEGHIDIGIHLKRFASLAERASDLVQSVVRWSLHECNSPKDMNLLAEAGQRLKGVCIFSLNHDLLIEDLLNGLEIPFSDGFSERDGDAIFFNGDWKPNGPLQLYKLHGSIDWYSVRHGQPRIDRFAKISDNVSHAKLNSNKWVDVLGVNPVFLTGTTIKERAYGFGLYGEIFQQFRHRLKEAEVLVCSGYGWSDKGINIRVNEWLRERPENKIILLYEGEEDQWRQIPFWRHRWDHFTERGKALHLPKWLGATSLDEVIELAKQKTT